MAVLGGTELAWPEGGIVGAGAMSGCQAGGCRAGTPGMVG